MKFAMDTAVSQFTVQAFATGLLSSFGHNPRIGIRDYDGEIQFVPGSYEKAFVRVSVRTNSMELLDEMKSDDRRKLEQLMYQEVLEVDRYADAVYESKELRVQKLSQELLTAHVSGDLSFHGVTRNHSFDARVAAIGTMLRISGEFALLQSDYRIKPISFAAGALRLKDELRFSFELVAKMQE